ncbi:MAG: undecaprenyl/decaprenyl-phosphate alpha-N-acetylglucosaminyl 1-phosphate transferase [Bacteroidales bacterium]|nr:undecaprenyl/decaprenyl-phosphate alpha-N-acetylglucosaminyl 1-phosphate transferase [Bacteroidales bacterium]
MEKEVLLILLALALSFVMVFVSIPTILTVSHAKKLYDEPGGRRIHKSRVPTLGGIAIFFSFLFIYSVYNEFGGRVIIPYLIPSMLVIFVIGVKDDILVTAPIVKFIGQIVAAAIIVWAGDLRFTNFYGLIPGEPGYLVSLLISIGFIVFIVNGFNLIDGIDGLASIIVIICILAFSLWFLINGQWAMVAIGAGIIGSVLGFLYYNMRRDKYKIFMGDTGSLILGFLVAIFTISFMEMNSVRSETFIPYRFSSSAGMALSVIILPAVDTIRVFVRRLIHGSSPFSADKSHIHHRLLSLGYSQLQVVMILSSVNIAFIIVSVVLRNIGALYLMVIILALGFLLLQIPSLTIKHRKRLLRKNCNVA